MNATTAPHLLRELVRLRSYFMYFTAAGDELSYFPSPPRRCFSIVLISVLSSSWEKSLTSWCIVCINCQSQKGSDEHNKKIKAKIIMSVVAVARSVFGLFNQAMTSRARKKSFLLKHERHPTTTRTCSRSNSTCDKQKPHRLEEREIQEIEESSSIKFADWKKRRNYFGYCYRYDCGEDNTNTIIVGQGYLRGQGTFIEERFNGCAQLQSKNKNASETGGDETFFPSFLVPNLARNAEIRYLLFARSPSGARCWDEHVRFDKEQLIGCFDCRLRRFLCATPA
jgi:hypothetical protein